MPERDRLTRRRAHPPRRLRGQGGDIIICEEAAFVNENTQFDAILPVLAVAKCAWLNISTPSKRSDDLFTMLMNNGVIRKLKIEQACSTCIAAGETEKCNHLQDDIPPWQSEENRNFLKGLYERRRVQFQREMQSVTSMVRPECFNEVKVRQVFTCPRGGLGGGARQHVFVAIDPAAGSQSSEGRGSDWAVVSITKPDCTIVGAEAIDVTGKGSSYEKLILNHIRLLLEIPELGSAYVVIILENNYGGVALAHLLESIQLAFPGRVVIMSEKEEKQGVWTSAEAKREMMGQLQIAFDMNQVQIADCFVTQHAKPAELVKDFMDQCLNYKEVREEYKGPLQDKLKIRFTGKTSDGMRDDLCMALQLAWWWRSQFVSDRQRYGRWLR